MVAYVLNFDNSIPKVTCIQVMFIFWKLDVGWFYYFGWFVIIIFSDLYVSSNFSFLFHHTVYRAVLMYSSGDRGGPGGAKAESGIGNVFKHVKKFLNFWVLADIKVAPAKFFFFWFVIGKMRKMLSNMSTLKSLIEELARLDFSDFLSTLLAIFHVINEKFHSACLLFYIVNKQAGWHFFPSLLVYSGLLVY